MVSVRRINMLWFRKHWWRVAVCVVIGLIFGLVASEGGWLFYFFFGFLAALHFLSVELDREQALFDRSVFSIMDKRIDLVNERLDMINHRIDLLQMREEVGRICHCVQCSRGRNLSSKS